MQPHPLRVQLGPYDGKAGTTANGRAWAVPRIAHQGHRHRDDIRLILGELTTLADLGLIELVVTWRGRLGTLLVGPEPTLSMAARATMALGGIQDCTIQFPDAPADELRTATVDAACATLGIS